MLLGPQPSPGWEVKPQSIPNSQIPGCLQNPLWEVPSRAPVNNYTPSAGLDFAKKNKALFSAQKAVLNVCCHLVTGMGICCQMTRSRKVFLSVT